MVQQSPCLWYRHSALPTFKGQNFAKGAACVIAGPGQQPGSNGSAQPKIAPPNHVVGGIPCWQAGVHNLGRAIPSCEVDGVTDRG